VLQQRLEPHNPRQALWRKTYPIAEEAIQMAKERISQMSHQDNAATEMQHSQKILSVSFVPDDQSAEVLKPREQSFDLPSPPISSQAPQILCFVFSVSAVRRDQFDTKHSEFCIKLVGVIGVVADQISWSFWDYDLDQGGDR
jgi:hypothetical protein